MITTIIHIIVGNISKNKLNQYIPNKIYRRQDLPKAYSHFHYLSCFKISEISKLNDELINKNTKPIFLNKKITKNLIEIDTMDDVKKFKKFKNKKKFKMILKKPKIKRSNQLYSIGKKIIPSGGQTYSKGVTQFTDGVAPKYLDSGKGAYAIDVDGNKYIDYVLACQPLILGYSDKDVNKAINKQLKKGSTFSLHNKLEIDVAKTLIEIVPSAEMVRFGKNGADATTIGIRLARAYTKRDEIAFCGYHGWHDWFIATTDLNGGIPKFNNDLIHKFNYNDIESLEKIFKKRKIK